MNFLQELALGQQLALAWFAFANLAAFVAMGLDKRRAVRGARRISERALCTWAAAGGMFGAWLGTVAFRHKTRKQSFRVKLALATLVGSGLVWLAWTRL